MRSIGYHPTDANQHGLLALVAMISSYIILFFDRTTGECCRNTCPPLSRNNYTAELPLSSYHQEARQGLSRDIPHPHEQSC